MKLNWPLIILVLMVSWYAIARNMPEPKADCYQEFAEKIRCGSGVGAYSDNGNFAEPSKVRDGEWGTGSGTTFGDAYMYIDYVYPEDANLEKSRWVIPDANGEKTEVALTASCIEQAEFTGTLSFWIVVKDFSIDTIEFTCKSKTGYDLLAVTQQHNLREEAMRWSFGG